MNGVNLFSKRVFLSGHSGFKGSWLCRILLMLGADIMGYSLEPSVNPNLHMLSEVDDNIDSVIADVRDYDTLLSAFQRFKPDYVIHMAAQPIVRESYKDPRYTYDTNVRGTVNVLECARRTDSVRSVLNVTTDKVYLNRARGAGYKEDEPLDGYDPYSNSKSCSELVTHSYKRSFFDDAGIPVSTARAGNVIGGGDFSIDRIIPDCVRAVTSGDRIVVRNPDSIRPYQHVLEPLMVYIDILTRQAEDKSLAGYYNVGPDEEDCLKTGELVDLFCEKWGEGVSWISQKDEGAPHEAGFLKLDCKKLKDTFGWTPRWHIDKSMEEVCHFSKVWQSGGNIPEEMDREIREFIG